MLVAGKADVSQEFLHRGASAAQVRCLGVKMTTVLMQIPHYSDVW